MRISYAIQAHPRRREMAEALAARLPDSEVVYDPEPDNPFPSPWRTYRRCLEETPAWATHRVVIQDDAHLCDHPEVAIRRALEARPTRLVALFVPGHPNLCASQVYKACGRDHSWAIIVQTWCPAVALSWPTGLVEPFLTYTLARKMSERYRADDQIIGDWLQAAAEFPYATVPSLVEHPDMTASLVGKRGRNGQYTGRLAACFADACSVPAHEIDWSPGPA